VKPLAAADPTSIASYRLVGVLGGGGMGRVYLGESRTGRRVAIKVVHEELAGDPVFRRRFAREVKVARKVSPLYTAAVVDADPDAPVPWLATTYIAGPTLTQLVIDSGPLSPRAVLILAAGLSDALASIHRVGLVHRDVKPSNVIIDDAGPHIIDFGIALNSETTRITTSVVVGTPSYIAPEIIYGDESSPASDVFSLGATLVFASSGRHLVEDGTMYTQIMQISRGAFDLESVPNELRPLVVRCISVEPRDRPTAEELATILVASGIPLPSPGWYRTREPVPGMDLTTALNRRTYARRRLLTVGGLAGGLAVVAAGTGWAVLGRGSSEPQAGSSTPPAAPRSGGTAPASGPGSVLWQAASGVPARPVSSDQPAVTRVVPDAHRHIIVASGSNLIAVNEQHGRVWTRPVAAASMTLRQWGNAVLVNDSRRVWLFDSGSGDPIFGPVDLAALEEKASRFDNPDHLAVEIGPVALSPSRAFVNLGTALVAINRKGEQVWRLPRAATSGGRRPPAEVPRYATDAWLVTHDATSTVVQVTLRQAGKTGKEWSIQYTAPPKPNGGGPPGGGPPSSRGPDGPGEGPPPGGDELWGRAEARIGGSYVVLRDSSAIRVVNLSGGRTVWNLPPARPITAIEIVGETLLVAADRLTAYALATGQVYWQSEHRGGRIALSGDAQTLIVADDEGLYGLDLTRTGEQRWHTPLPSGVAPETLTTDGKTAYLSFRGEGGPDAPLKVDLFAVSLV
jgi:serine/threonine protein kinase